MPVDSACIAEGMDFILTQALAGTHPGTHPGTRRHTHSRQPSRLTPFFCAHHLTDSLINSPSSSSLTTCLPPSALGSLTHSLSPPDLLPTCFPKGTGRAHAPRASQAALLHQRLGARGRTPRLGDWIAPLPPIASAEFIRVGWCWWAERGCGGRWRGGRRALPEARTQGEEGRGVVGTIYREQVVV